MPTKFKPSQKLLVDRQSKKTKTVHFYMKTTPTKELQEAYERVEPKIQQKIKNELVRRKVAV